MTALAKKYFMIKAIKLIPGALWGDWYWRVIPLNYSLFLHLIFHLCLISVPEPSVPSFRMSSRVPRGKEKRGKRKKHKYSHLLPLSSVETSSKHFLEIYESPPEIETWPFKQAPSATAPAPEFNSSALYQTEKWRPLSKCRRVPTNGVETAFFSSAEH